MIRIPKESIDEMLSRVRPSEIIGRRVTLKKKGSVHWACCPFHGEKTPSFTVNDIKGIYHCFGCEAHGTVITFIMEHEKKSFLEAVNQLATETGYILPKKQLDTKSIQKYEKIAHLKKLMETACKFYETQLFSSHNRTILAYVTNRGINLETIKKFRLGYSSNINHLKKHLQQNGYNEEQMIEVGLLISKEQSHNQRLYERFRNRIMFPIANYKGEIIAFGGRVLDKTEPKYLNSPETILFNKGKNLYALHLSKASASKNNRLIICEGYMDVIALHQAGLEYAVAPLGTALTKEQILIAWNYANNPILCFDGDKAGIAATQRSALRILPLMNTNKIFSFLTLPDKEDPDSYLQKNSPQDFIKLLANAVPFSHYLWQTETIEGYPELAEHRALLEKKLMEYVALIQDKILANHFRNYFKNSLWNAQITSNKIKNSMKKYTHFKKYSKNDEQIIITQPTQKQRLNQHNNTDNAIASLLIGCIKFPNILKSQVDKLHNIPNSSNPELNKLKNTLIEIAEELHEQLDENYDIIKLLQEYNLEHTYNLINNENILKHNTWLDKEYHCDRIKYWLIIFEKLILEEIKSQYENLLDDIKESPTLEKLQQLNALTLYKIEIEEKIRTFEI